MIKKLGLLAVVAMAFAGSTTITAQATSGLTWTQSGAHLGAGTNPTFTALGKLMFSNVTWGTVECPFKAEVTLTGGSSTAHVNELAVTSTGECVLSGPVNTACSSLIGHQVTGTGGSLLNTANGGAWLATGTLNAGVASMDVLSEAVIHTEFTPRGHPAGTLCAKKVKLETTATAKPTVTFDSANGLTKATFGGTMTATNAETGAHLGAVNVTGTLVVQGFSSGIYGIT